MKVVKSDPQKQIPARVRGVTYQRFLVKSPIIKAKDDLLAIVDRLTKRSRRKKDIIVISERIVAIAQGRSYPVTTIQPSFLAHLLHRFVYRHPGGVGLRSPYTMELALREAGMARILLAALATIVTKPFGLRGIFYRVAGHNINAIDGPTPYSLPPSDKSAKLPPKEPEKEAQNLENALGLGVVIIDANDYGVNVLGISDLAENAGWPIAQIFSDNPMGQAREQTPLAIVRRVKVAKRIML